MYATVIVGAIVSGLMQGGAYALVSVGLTMIFGVMRIMNFAHGEFLMLSMYASFWLFQLYGVNPYVSLFMVIPTFFVIGWAVQRIIIQPIIHAPPLNQIFATVGV